MFTKPNKRNENIVILSHEHNLGLLFCWKIKQGIRKNIGEERIQKYVSYFWNNHLHHYFKKEDEYLLLKVRDDKCAKGIKQHEDIRLQFSRINEAVGTLSYDQLLKLSDSLEAHIRFEERDLFPHLEKTLDELELNAIGTLIQDSQHGYFKNNYPDEFLV